MNTLLSSDAVDISTPRGIVNGVYLYIGWLGETVSELWAVGVDTTKIVGNVIKVDEKEAREFDGTNFSFRDAVANWIRKD
jgi:hypothetical protein